MNARVKTMTASAFHFWNSVSFACLLVGLLVFECKTGNRQTSNICCKKCVVDIQLSFITLKYRFQPLDGSPVQSTKHNIKPCNQNAGPVQRCFSFKKMLILNVTAGNITSFITITASVFGSNSQLFSARTQRYGITGVPEF